MLSLPGLSRTKSCRFLSLGLGLSLKPNSQNLCLRMTQLLLDLLGLQNLLLRLLLRLLELLCLLLQNSQLPCQHCCRLRNLSPRDVAAKVHVIKGVKVQERVFHLHICSHSCKGIGVHHCRPLPYSRQVWLAMWLCCLDHEI